MTTKEQGKVDQIMVRRLTRLYSWFFEESLYKDIKLADVLRREPQAYLDEAKRPNDEDFDWHLGRVRYLYEELLNGKDHKPISVDNICHGLHIYPEPVLVDGHHRLAAYFFARRRMIPAYYSGRVDLLDYLTGKRSLAWLRGRP